MEQMNIRSYALITREYLLACEKHPGFSEKNIERAFVILGEEVGEVAKAIYENDHDNLEVEIAQVAAVYLRMLELVSEKHLDR